MCQKETDSSVIITVRHFQTRQTNDEATSEIDEIVGYNWTETSKLPIWKKAWEL